MSQHAIHNAHKNPNDVIYTPLPVALRMIQMCDIKPFETVLDPSRGGGVFFDNLPGIKDYAEITEQRDFFDNTAYYDVIVGNPPYSMWTKWLQHTVTKCNRFCYIFGAQSMTPNRLKMIEDAGFGITMLHTVKIAWYMSQSYILLCERGKPSIMTYTPGTLGCEHCNTNCNRGVFGNPPNICNYDNKVRIAQEKREAKLKLKIETKK